MPEIGALLIGAAIAGYAAILVGWRVLLRRWRLAGPRAPPRAVLGRQEVLARRWLEALLALDAVLIVPLAVVAVALAVLRDPDATFLIVIALFFLMPVPGMLRKVRVLEAYRVRGLPEPGPEQRTTGHEPLDRLLRRPARAAQATAAVIVAVSVAAW